MSQRFPSFLSNIKHWSLSTTFVILLIVLPFCNKSTFLTYFIWFTFICFFASYGHFFSLSNEMQSVLQKWCKSTNLSKSSLLQIEQSFFSSQHFWHSQYNALHRNTYNNTLSLNSYTPLPPKHTSHQFLILSSNYIFYPWSTFFSPVSLWDLCWRLSLN